MARKSRAKARTNAKAMLQVAGEGAGTFVGSALGGVFDRVHYETDRLMDKFETRALTFRKHVMHKMFASILIGVGSLFIIVSLLMYLVALFNMRWATALLIIGILVLVIAFIVNMQDRR